MDEKSRADIGPRIDGQRHVPSLLIQFSNRLSSATSDAYVEMFGIGINEFRILTTIVKWPGCFASFLADQIGIHKAIVSRSLKTLEEAGLVAGSSEVRARKLYLTQAGIELHNRAAETSLAREKLLLNGFSAEEVELLRTLLRRLDLNLTELKKQRHAVGSPGGGDAGVPGQEGDPDS